MAADGPDVDSDEDLGAEQLQSVLETVDLVVPIHHLQNKKGRGEVKIKLEDMLKRN